MEPRNRELNKWTEGFDDFVDATVARMVARYGYTENMARYELAARVVAGSKVEGGPPAFFRDGRDMKGNDV